MQNQILFSLLISSLLSNSVLAGKIAESQTKWIEVYKKQAAVPDPATQRTHADPEPDLSEGFVSLYNGESLDGWVAYGGQATFTAEAGFIKGEHKGPSTYLSTVKNDYTDFIATVEIKQEVDGNTGMVFRGNVRKGKKGDSVFGPQVEMEQASKQRFWSGGLYWQSCGGWKYPVWLEEHEATRNAMKPGEWNRLTVKAVGPSIKTWLNGVPAAHVVSDEYLKGFISLQVHAGKQGTILFRNIKIKELK